ncbi:aspartate aminotransferase-like isoform X4 [Dreissena polymorpha]|uniref:aspartate aminotransferase-like isoform X4 n=1 Tax=Dreissena polymorpha TaxID=45954 RepID=UPI00226445F7|nr:aspartate aminotransferase-like isoform X4 [Dreissena polymorpha]
MDFSKDQLVRKTLENYSGASNLMHNEKVRELMAAGKKIYHFGFGQSPFPIMNKAAERLSKHASKAAYLPVAGIQDLRYAICDFHKRYDDISRSPDDVIVGPGSKELIFLLMNIFEGDIIVISPSWTSYKPQVQLSQHAPRVIVANMADKWKITPASFKQFLESENFSTVKLLILNNPDNPTGTLYTKEELISLRDVCRQHKVIVLADEIYARLTYDGDFTSMAQVYPEGTVLCSGMSKWASMGGWRVGYHIFPPELTSLKNAVKNAASNTYTSVAAPIQYAITEVLQDHAICESYMFHTNRIMAAVAEYCHRELTDVGVKAVVPKGGFYIFPNFEVLRETLTAQGIHTCEQMVEKLFRETAVSVMAGGPGFLRPETELTVRLCFVHFDGSDALLESERIGRGTPFPEDFVRTHCTNVHDGIQKMSRWVINLLSEKTTQKP